MIHYFTNREIAEKLNINLARWKRWSRAFLPPDPLGGLQSGYARQYVFKDLFKVYLGGFLLSHLKCSVIDAQAILSDLTPWLKKAGFLELNGSADKLRQRVDDQCPYRIYLRCLNPANGKKKVGFAYLIQKFVDIRPVPENERQTIQTVEETILGGDSCDGSTFFRVAEVGMINLSALFDDLVDRLTSADPV